MNLRAFRLPQARRLAAFIAPGGARLRRGNTLDELPLPAGTREQPWQAALAALDAALASQAGRDGEAAEATGGALADMLAPRIDVVLSEHFTHWKLLPWQPGLNSAEEQAAFARHAFREAFGEPARHWLTRCAGALPGRPIPACAIDERLFAALGELAAAHGLRLGQVEPLFTAAEKRWQRGLRGNPVWFAVAERDRISLGLRQGTVWQALHSEPCEPAARAHTLASLRLRLALAHGLAADAGALHVCGENLAQFAHVTPLPRVLGSALS